MAISPALIKGVAALGAVSTLTAGGVLWYTKKESKYENIDKFVLNTKEGIWTVDKTTGNPSAENNTYEITTKLTGKNNNEGKTWICKIKGTTQSPVSESSWDMEKQLTSLKTEIGIEENKPRDFGKNEKFKKFIENCKRHGGTDNTYEIDLGDLELNNKAYKFKNSNFQKIYEEEYWSQKLKEQQLNIACTGSSCSVISEKQLEGFVDETGKTISITKSTKEDPERFSDGIGYSVSNASNNKNGNYKIDKKVGGGFELKKVENLTLEKLCEKIGLIYDSGTPTGCSVSTETNWWIANFYESDTSYKKGLKITGISKVSYDSSNCKFTPSGTPAFDSTKAEGTMTFASGTSLSTGYYAKYIPKLKAYALVKAN